WTALTEGVPQRALQVVAEHRDRFADGALVPERDAIAAIARCRTAATGRAAQGEAFARIHGDSPLLERVRSACAEE
ncbi:MAG: hypothetical protein IAG13_31860, partial [Deltaproteobacteria bacterium]|nr:hypothetical protein [Nannocystaceae bacterium]